MANKNNRWALAQEYEFNWWESKKETIKADYYQQSAAEIRQFCLYNKDLKTDTVILEIGSGATGILTFLNESDFRFGIDPLESYYSTVELFAKLRDPKVKYQTAKGESLPFENEMFDIIIIDNVLDHCENPYSVMEEVTRVMKIDALIYFRQNTYNLYGKTARFIMEMFLIDKGHPYTFTMNDLHKLFEKNKLKMLNFSEDGYFNTWRNEMFSKSLKDKVKALLFITRNKIACFVCKL